MPKNSFINSFRFLLKRLNLLNRGHGALYVDNQRENLNNYFYVTSQLMSIFNISREAVEIRLKRFKLLNDARGKNLVKINKLLSL